MTPSSTPVAVSGNLVFKQISSYTMNTCGVTTSGRAYCWGEGWSLCDHTRCCVLLGNNS